MSRSQSCRSCDEARARRKKQDSKNKKTSTKKKRKTLSSRWVSMSVSLLPPRARVVSIPIAVTHGTARARRKRRTQRRRDPRIRARNRIRRNRGPVNAFRRLTMSVPVDVRLGRQRMTSLLILMWRVSVELLWPICRCAHRSTDRRRRS